MGDASKFRLLASWIDNSLALIFALFPTASIPGLADSARWAIAILLFLLYFFVQEGVFGSTAGKRLCGLSLVREDGGRSGWYEASVRTLLRIFEVNPFLLSGLPAGLTILSTEKRQRLGDLLAKTYVVRSRPSQE